MSEFGQEKYGTQNGTRIDNAIFPHQKFGSVEVVEIFNPLVFDLFYP